MVKKLIDKKEILHVFDDFLSWMTIKQVSKKIGLSYQPTYVYLHELESDGLLAHKREGNVHLYSLNFKDKRILGEMFNIEFRKTQNFLKGCEKKIKDSLNELIEQLNEFQIWIALLFGSTARKSRVERSDIDVFIAGDSEGKIKRICNTINMKYDVKLSPVVVSLREFRKMLLERNDFTQSLLKERIILLGFENYFNELIKSMEKLKWI